MIYCVGLCEVNSRNGVRCNCNDLGILIILIAVAVVLNSILSSNNSDGDAVKRQTLIVIAGSGLHYAFDVIYFTGFSLFQIAGELVKCSCCFCSIGCLGYQIEVDNIQQIKIALVGFGSTLVDLCLPLQSQIALVGNSEALGQIAAARLPEKRFSFRTGGFGKVQRFDMRIAVRTDNIHFKIA